MQNLFDDFDDELSPMSQGHRLKRNIKLVPIVA
jgi:hypothetical protein